MLVSNSKNNIEIRLPSTNILLCMFQFPKDIYRMKQSCNVVKLNYFMELFEKA
jgi:hypothetical protein